MLVDGDGQIIAHPDPSRLDDDVSSYPAVQRARQSRGAGEVVARNAAGIERLFVYQAMPNPATLAKQPWVLLTEIDRSQEMAGLRRLQRELLVGIALVVLGCLFVAWEISRSVSGPLVQLTSFARRVGSGDLTGRTGVAGRDVAGQLAAAFDEMVAGLRERDHVKDVFGQYIATQVSDKILSGQVDLGGESRRVTMLFSDIRNFTTMAEQLSPQQVVAFLNDYFSEMVDAVFEQDGVLDKFIGDGLLAVFGLVDEAPDHPRRAVLTALRMRALLGKINGERAVSGQPPIAIGIGVHTDEVIVGNIGSHKRLRVHCRWRRCEHDVTAAGPEQGVRHDNPDQRDDVPGGEGRVRVPGDARHPPARQEEGPAVLRGRQHEDACGVERTEALGTRRSQDQARRASHGVRHTSAWSISYVVRDRPPSYRPPSGEAGLYGVGGGGGSRGEPAFTQAS